MTDYVEMLARRLRETPDKPVSLPDLAAEFGLSEPRMARGMGSLMKRTGFYDLGGGRVMFTGNSDLAAFEIFKTAAIHITFEEYLHYKDQPHILMRMSRDREIACGPDPERLLKDAIREKEKSRGNTVF
jgi:hypothetical protein